ELRGAAGPSTVQPCAAANFRTASVLSALTKSATFRRQSLSVAQNALRAWTLVGRPLRRSAGLVSGPLIRVLAAAFQTDSGYRGTPAARDSCSVCCNSSGVISGSGVGFAADFWRCR